MTRRGLGVAFLVSVLVTVGTLAVLLVRQDVPKDEPAADADPAAAPSPSPSGKPAKAAPRPGAGACYRLAYDDAVAPTSRRKPVSCSGAVTARTFYVGTLDTVVDGHLLAVDSDPGAAPAGRRRARAGSRRTSAATSAPAGSACSRRSGSAPPWSSPTPGRRGTAATRSAVESEGGWPP